MNTAVDTLDLAKQLQGLGFTKKQSEALPRMLADIVDDVAVSKSELDLRLKDIEMRLTIKMYGSQIALFFALITFLRFFNG